MDKVDDEHADDGGGTEAEKRKRRQDRHRVLERKRREKTQGLLSEIHQVPRLRGTARPGGHPPAYVPVLHLLWSRLAS